MPYVAYANVCGLPALTIPVAIDEHGLPLSIQIMSAKGNEDAIFRLGRVLEKNSAATNAAPPSTKQRTRLLSKNNNSPAGIWHRRDLYYFFGYGEYFG